MADVLLQELINLLQAAARQPGQRQHFIAKFQQAVWDAPEDSSAGREWEILRDLAYDLDFYEPNETSRAESSSYFGDEQAEKEIEAALAKLKPEKDSMM